MSASGADGHALTGDVASAPVAAVTASAFVGFQCSDCGELSRDPLGLCRDCGAIRLAAYDTDRLRSEGITRSTFEHREPLLLGRWAELMPFSGEDGWRAASLGETESALVD